MIVKGYYLPAEGDLRCNLTEQEIKAAFDSRQGLLWVDISGAAEGDGSFLKQNFHFHHLAIEDCIGPIIHSPKIDDLGSYLFIIVHGINPVSESEMPETAEMALFLGSHFVVSVHRVPLHCIDTTMHLVEDDGRPMRHSADFLAHARIDVLIDNILPSSHTLAEQCE